MCDVLRTVTLLNADRTLVNVYSQEDSMDHLVRKHAQTVTWQHVRRSAVTAPMDVQMESVADTCKNMCPVNCKHAECDITLFIRMNDGYNGALCNMTCSDQFDNKILSKVHHWIPWAVL